MSSKAAFANLEKGWGCVQCGLTGLTSENQLQQHLASGRHAKKKAKKSSNKKLKHCKKAKACAQTTEEDPRGTAASYCPILGLAPWIEPLDLELASQKKTFQDKLELWSADRLVHEGLRIEGLAAQRQNFDPKTVRFFRPAAGESKAFMSLLPRHALSVGDVVDVSNPAMPTLERHATVISVSKNFIDVSNRQAPPPAPAAEAAANSAAAAAAAVPEENLTDVVASNKGSRWNLQKGFSDTPFARMREALASVKSPLGLRGALGSTLALEHLPCSDLLLSKTMFRPLSLETFTPAPPPPAADSAELALLALGGSGGHLNASQQEALSRCLDNNEPVVLIHGPPGTGKSRLLASAVLDLVAVGDPNPNLCEEQAPRVLVVAESNVGVDNVLVAILNDLERRESRAPHSSAGPLSAGLSASPNSSGDRPCKRVRVEAVSAGQGPPVVSPVVRVGKSSAAVSSAEPRLEAVSLLALAAADERYGQLEAMRSGFKPGGEAKKKKELKTNWGGAKNLEFAIQRAVIESARIVCTTIMGCGGMTMKQSGLYDVIVFDEACSCSVPAATVALQRLSQNGRVILAGDPLQLPPTVLDSTAKATGLGCSLFEFIAGQRGGREPVLLSTQYRMHPALAHFPGRHFYGGKLGCSGAQRVDAVRACRSLPRWPAPGRLGPVSFLEVPRPCSGGPADLESADAQGSSQNASEVSLIVTIVRSLERANVLPSSAIVLTPYEGQRVLLSKVLAQQGSRVVVSTIDGFQGQEADFVLVSTVRSNARRAVGFLEDWRRMNVALTRARAGLLVVGSRATLKGDPNWSAWLDWVQKKNVFILDLLLCLIALFARVFKLECVVPLIRTKLWVTGGPSRSREPVDARVLGSSREPPRSACCAKGAAAAQRKRGGGAGAASHSQSKREGLPRNPRCGSCCRPRGCLRGCWRKRPPRRRPRRPSWSRRGE